MTEDALHKPDVDALKRHVELASTELNNLYYVGLRWMDRARKAEYLNTELVEALEAARRILADMGHYDDDNYPVFQHIAATLDRNKKAMTDT